MFSKFASKKGFHKAHWQNLSKCILHRTALLENGYSQRTTGKRFYCRYCPGSWFYAYHQQRKGL